MAGLRAASRKSAAGKSSELLGGGGDVEHVLALGHHQVEGENVAARDAVEDLDRARRRG